MRDGQAQMFSRATRLPTRMIASTAAAAFVLALSLLLSVGRCILHCLQQQQQHCSFERPTHNFGPQSPDARRQPLSVAAAAPKTRHRTIMIISHPIWVSQNKKSLLCRRSVCSGKFAANFACCFLSEKQFNFNSNCNCNQ